MKAKMIHQRDSSLSPEPIVSRNKMRERIEEKLNDLMNQRKELVITQVRGRKQGSALMHYSSSRDKNRESFRKKMPDYVQNMYINHYLV